MNRKDFIKWGSKGGKKKSFNYRQHLLVELSKLVDKGKLNFYQEVASLDYSGRMLREALMVERKRKNEHI